MYLLFQNGRFSELHLPSLNHFAEKGSNILIKKQIPILFEKRVNELINLFEISKLTNIQLNKKEKKGNEIFLELSSIKGDLLEGKKLSITEKEKLVDLFFKYHQEINVPNISFSHKYLDFFSNEDLKKKINEIKVKIAGKEKTKFDLFVLDYLENFLMQNLPELDYSKFSEQNVHGDFSQRNIVSTKEGLTIIDLEMAHRGYLELEFLKFLSHLFEFGSISFFRLLKKSIRKYNLSWMVDEDYFKLYLRHKLMDISVIKSAYFSNDKKYLVLQNYIIELIKGNKRLVKGFNKNCNKFNSII